MVVPLPPPQRHHLDKLEHVHSDQQGFHGHPHLVAPKRTPEMRKTADPAGGDPENESPFFSPRSPVAREWIGASCGFALTIIQVEVHVSV